MILDHNKFAREWKIKFAGAGANIFTAQKYIPLQKLEVMHNKIRKFVLESELPLLQILDLSHNVLECLAGLENARCLTKLCVGYNRLTSLCPELGTLQMLQELDASHNNITRFAS